MADEYDAKAQQCAIIAKPLAPHKLSKKLLKLCKKATKKKQVKRGVKEVVKAVRKKNKGCVTCVPMFMIPEQASVLGARLAACACDAARSHAASALASRSVQSASRLLCGMHETLFIGVRIHTFATSATHAHLVSDIAWLTQCPQRDPSAPVQAHLSGRRHLAYRRAHARAGAVRGPRHTVRLRPVQGGAQD